MRPVFGMFLILLGTFSFCAEALAQTITITPLEVNRSIKPIRSEPVPIPTLVQASPVLRSSATPFIMKLENITPTSCAQTGPSSFVVVGWMSGGYPAVLHVTQLSDGTFRTTLQQLPALMGMNFKGRVHDVTSNGQTFVGSSISPLSITSNGEATMWDVAGNPVVLGPIPGKLHDSGMSAVSDNLIGVGINESIPTVFLNDGTAIGLAFGETGIAGAISKDGRVLGGGTDSGPVYWTTSTPGSNYLINSMGLPPDAYAPLSFVLGVSPDANWMSGTYASNDAEDFVSIIWNGQGQIVTTLGPGDAIDVTNGGVTAHNAHLGDGEYEARLYIPGRGIVSLPRLFKEQGVNYRALYLEKFGKIYRLRRVEGGTTDGLLMVGRASTGATGANFFAYVKVSDPTTASVSPTRTSSRKRP